MNQAELLAELDTYFAARKQPEYLRSIGPLVNPDLIKIYQVHGAILRVNNRYEVHDVVYAVYDEGEVGEAAYYSGDPINFFWQLEVIDHITVTNQWNGRIFHAVKPKAICRILQTPAEGEKWVLVTETAPDTWQVDDITGEVFTG